MSDEIGYPNLCTDCGNVLYRNSARGGQLVCINTKCLEYFEPAVSRVPQGTVDGVAQNTLGLVPRGHGIKLDTGKVPVYTEFLQQFPTAMKLVAWVGDQGSRAPGHVRSGWKAVDNGFERYSNAMGRHLEEEVQMLTADEASSEDPDHDILFQVATVAWNAMARLELLAKDKPGALARIFGERVDTKLEV